MSAGVCEMFVDRAGRWAAAEEGGGVITEMSEGAVGVGV